MQTQIRADQLRHQVPQPKRLLVVLQALRPHHILWTQGGAIMKYLVIATALLLGGCHDFKCIDGKVYRNLDGDTWIESGLWVGTRCTTIKEKQ